MHPKGGTVAFLQARRCPIDFTKMRLTASTQNVFEFVWECPKCKQVYAHNGVKIVDANPMPKLLVGYGGLERNPNYKGT